MNAGTDIYLSIIIPAFNEEERIKSTLPKIIHYCQNENFQYEIRIIDDGSQDKTTQVVKSVQAEYSHERIYLFRNHLNHGKGYAIKQGMLQARGRFVLFCDADLSTPIQEVKKLLTFLEKDYHIAIGSRGKNESMVITPQPWYRQYMGKFFNILVQLFVLKGIRDTQCGFKCFKKEAALNIFRIQKLWGFCFDVEVLVIARKKGYKICEVPIVWDNSKASRVHIIKDSSRMFLDLIKLCFVKKYF